MKAILKSLTVVILLGAAACSQPNNANEAASDTASILDTNRNDTPLDTTAVLDVRGDTAAQTANPSQHREANGQQSSRVNVGSDTTGKQAQDQKP